MPSDADVDPPGGGDRGWDTPGSPEDQKNRDFTMTSDKYFDVEELDDQEQNLLLFMCLCSYIDSQDRFLDAYKEVLVNRAVDIESKDCNDGDTLYALLKETVTKQKRALRCDDASDEEDDDDDGDDDSTSESEPERHDTSLLRDLVQMYHLEVYLKLMLLAFLLKMPPLSYAVVTTFYAVYVFLTATIVRLVRSPVFHWQIARRAIVTSRYIYRNLIRFLLYTRRATAPRDTGSAVMAARRSVAETAREIPTVIEGDSPRRRVRNTNNGRQRPSRFAKVMYQLFVAYVLSLLPWWEPNPAYIEESD
ncbi:uncharacterized protein BXIN_0078 [Babesia sp. Xinjiang]|uniref:uncharacterized protein n=1 Tax=Babesia sp. Xinjiang TaxID=462227 RepID=UPI000A23549E|nr:uncharacterized protein BXIN_0078 [Babesia sp. Xinjiang]ORM39695.1 hypothetical protein BXIN_0078 [Babesia sp. Xinjiang]